MEYKIIEKILAFLNDNEGKPQPKKWVNFRKSVRWKLLHNEPLMEKELGFNGSLDLENSKITSLPEGLRVRDHLWLENCTNLTSLPNRLEVGGWLYLENCTSLTSLPEGLKVGGVFNLINCTSLESLPEGLEVGKELNLIGCTNLTSLPKGLKVVKDLLIRNTLLAKLSDDDLRKMIDPNGDGYGYIKGNIIRS
jgi:hypothetical protein